ncbi:hypothetical protein ACIG47_19445 [Promicromonospora sp. NPDC052451]|uniref:hypothetical protein n=1 Tax=Promicromonospora sp. NPDC052451 TaxID=3364407 RepID=UPI0037C9F9DA
MATDPHSALGRYLAKLPYVLGHQLSDDQVVAGLFDPHGTAIAHATERWDPIGGPGRFTGRFAHALQDVGPIDHAVVVGYGPDGGAWACDLATELREVFDARSTVLHVQDGSWRVLDNLTETWGPSTALPAQPPDIALLGTPEPAASRDDLVASVKPLPGPIFADLDHAKATHLASLSPATCADLARSALDQLARGRVDNVPHQQSLAHLVNTSIIVRDAVLAHAIQGTQHRQRVDALVRTFRAAPSSLRPVLATTAAAAAFLTGWHPPQVEGLLRHTDPTDRLTHLVQLGHDRGANPAPARRTILESADNQLQEAEAAWTTNQTAKRTTQPTDARTSTQHPAEPPSTDTIGI